MIDDVNASGCIPVIPWGFGKWTGKRGRIIKGLLEKEQSFFLGDNSGRSELLPYPSHFTHALERGVKILPGSDPLPFISEVNRPGCFGFSIEGSLSPDTPAEDLKRMLYMSCPPFRSYGSLETGCRFVKHQVGMQVLKRLKKGIL